MRHLCLRVAGVAGVVMALCASHASALAAEANAQDKNALEYRRHLMITLNEQSGALGMILSGTIPNGDAAAHLEAIALAASYATKAFTPHVEGGEARPEVWTKWADFSKRMDEFARKTAAVAKTVREKGPQGVNVLDALACKACHDLYRDETKR